MRIDSCSSDDDGDAALRVTCCFPVSHCLLLLPLLLLLCSILWFFGRLVMVVGDDGDGDGQQESE
jgi:hypothetical protein